MSSFELTLSPLRLQRNPLTGRFLKGHSPAIKGKKYEDYYTREQIEVFNKSRVLPHPNENTWNSRRKRVVTVIDGKAIIFPSVTKAQEWLGRPNANIARSCKKGVRCAGYRFWYESDSSWMEAL